jgi:hypothetical protein
MSLMLLNLFIPKITILFKCGSCFIRRLLALCGVRQGCPSSSSIFTAATVCIIRYLLWVHFKDDMLRAYCDDIAVIVANLWLSAPALALAFCRIARACNLHLNLPKCVCVPCWKFSHRLATRSIADIVPLWHNIRIAWWAVYLGFAVGPEAHLHVWESAFNNYRIALCKFTNSETGLHASILIYNIFVLPTLLYIAQLDPIPKYISKFERRNVIMIFPAPYKWCTLLRLIHMKHFLPFRSSIISLEVMSFAVRARTILRTLPNWAVWGTCPVHPWRARACSRASQVSPGALWSVDYPLAKWFVQWFFNSPGRNSAKTHNPLITHS